MLDRYLHRKGAMNAIMNVAPVDACWVAVDPPPNVCCSSSMRIGGWVVVVVVHEWHWDNGTVMRGAT